MGPINDGNFNNAFNVIKESIEDSQFIAVDLEFLGIPSFLHENSPSLFDTPTARYEKLRQFVRSTPPCQLGLACFKQTSEANGYKADVYTIPLFKRLANQMFCFQPSALRFLVDSSFDVNKCIADGVTFSNRSEVSKILSLLDRGLLNYNTILGSRADERFEKLTATILDLLSEADDVDKDGNVCHIVGEVTSVRLCGTSSNLPESSELFIFKQPVDMIEAALILYHLNVAIPTVKFQLNDERSELHFSQRECLLSAAEKGELLQYVGTQFSGVAVIFEFIANLQTLSKPVFVGHNSLLDFLHIYNYFVDDLPESYEKWKESMASIFRHIIDTKVLATAMSELLNDTGVPEFSLPTLSKFIETEKFRLLCPFLRLKIDHSDVDSAGDYSVPKSYHDAGFDAFSTGKLFLKLAGLYCSQNVPEMKKGRMAIPVHKLVGVFRTNVLNRLPIALIDAGACYLTGDDPIGSRPDYITVSRKRAWYQVADEILAVEVEELKAFLRLVYGDFRFDAKLSDDHKKIVIATNTASTYAHICSILARDPVFVLDDGSKSYDKRLLDSRITKDGNSESQERRSSSIKKLAIGSFSIFAMGYIIQKSFSTFRFRNLN